MTTEALPAKSGNKTSFKGNFHFVNYDHDRKTAPHRNAVFSHVQNQYWRWKRKEDARLLRESAKVPITGSKSNKLPGIQQGVGDHSTAQEPIDADSRTGDEREGEQDAAVPAECGPLTILKKGQSDPFNAFAIPIDASVNFLMTYCRDVELPSVHRDGTNPKGVFVPEEWNQCVSHLSEPYSAYAHLTRVASAIPGEVVGGKSDLAIKALTFRGKGVKLLREKLDTEDALKDERVFGAISSMLHAEMYNNNISAALFHGKMLAHMLQSGAVTVNPRRTFEAIYYDYQRAIMSFTRTSFDYEIWIPQHFAAVWSQVRKTLPEYTTHAAVTKGLETTIDDEKFRTIFINVRHLTEVFVLGHVDVKFENDSIRAYMRAQAVHIMGQSLNHYIDSVAAMNRYKDQNILTGHQVTHARVQSVLSLALLYWLRFVSKTDSFVIGEKKTIFVANAGLLKRFREAYDDYDAFTLDADALQYSRSMMWALYIGAWSEELLVLKKQPDKPWFGPRLGLQAKKMGIGSWQEVRELLLGFIHMDSLPPNGSLWFHKTLEKVEVSTYGEEPSD